MTLKLLLQMSLCVFAVIQTSSSQPSDEFPVPVPARDEVDSISRREQARSKLLAVLAQLQRNIAEMQAIVLQYHEPEEGPIDTTPEPETTPEPTTPEPVPGEKQTGILHTFYLFSWYVQYVGRISPIWQNVRVPIKYTEVKSLVDIGACHELVSVRSVLLELISVHEGAFSLSHLDDIGIILIRLAY